MEHSKLPWMYENASGNPNLYGETEYIESEWWHIHDTERKIVAIVDDEKIAAFIVRACNMHDELMEILQNITDQLDTYWDEDNINFPTDETEQMIQQARAILAKAKSE